MDAVTTKTGAQRALAAGQSYCPQCERMYPDGDHCPEDGSRLVKIKAVKDPLLGRVLDGRYTIIEKLGQGGMGAVYRAAQHSVDREVAVKVVNAHLVSDPDAIRRFLREAKIASRLSHPNAVGVLDFGQSDDGLFYLVMELVAGSTLDQVLKGGGTMRPDRIVRIGAQVCDALEGAHALQIVHRDLKPANIMLLSHGRDLVKVLDFGLAKSVATDNAVTTMTNAGALLGTPAFMPPELALGQPCDGRADLYALGCILYLLGSGRLPFTSDSPHELIAAHAHDPAPPMTGVPEALAAVVDRLLEKDPNKRFQTAAETREALEASVDGRFSTPYPINGDTPPSIRPVSGMNRSSADELVTSETIAAPTANAVTMSEPRRRRWVVPVLAAFALAGAGVGALVATSGGDAERAATEEIAPAVTPEVAKPAAEPAPTDPPSPPPQGSASNAVETQQAAAPLPPSPTIPAKTPAKTPTKKTSSKSGSAKAPAHTTKAAPTTTPPTKTTAPPPPAKGSGALPF